MKFHHLLLQAVMHKEKVNERKGKDPGLTWWQLMFIGIGSIIGAGFFLGTGVSIKIAGPAILIGYLFGGVTGYLVFSALAEMTIYDPQHGSFRTYAKKAHGRAMGYINGWMYWCSGILIMSSEIIALSTFTRFWFPEFPLWLFSLIYALLGFGINLLGVKDFGTVESSFAIVKLSTLIIFILFGFLFLSGLITPHNLTVQHGAVFTDFFPTGFMGFWSALIFIYFSFGGIVVVGIAANELKKKTDISKTGKGLLLTLVIVYILSLFLVLKMVSFRSLNELQSPFVTALSAFRIPYIDSVFNIIIITAAFSTMVGALYSITNVLVSLSNDGEAPKIIAEKNKRGVPTKSLGLSGIVLAVILIMSYFVPNAIYEYITTAGGVLLILNWALILYSHRKLHRDYVLTENYKTHRYHLVLYPYSNYFGIFLIFFTIAGGIIQPRQRVSIIVSFVIILIIALSYYIYHLTDKENKIRQT